MAFLWAVAELELYCTVCISYRYTHRCSILHLAWCIHTLCYNYRVKTTCSACIWYAYTIVKIVTRHQRCSNCSVLYTASALAAPLAMGMSLLMPILSLICDAEFQCGCSSCQPSILPVAQQWCCTSSCSSVYEWRCDQQWCRNGG